MRVRVRRALRELDKRTRHSLTPGKDYGVLGVESGWFRIINDRCEPVLFPPKLFVVIDSSIPENWVELDAGTDEWTAYPPPLSRRRFFEDYFDDEPVAREELAAHVQTLRQAGYL